MKSRKAEVVKKLLDNFCYASNNLEFLIESGIIEGRECKYYTIEDAHGNYIGDTYSHAFEDLIDEIAEEVDIDNLKKALNMGQMEECSNCIFNSNEFNPKEAVCTLSNIKIPEHLEGILDSCILN